MKDEIKFPVYKGNTVILGFADSRNSKNGQRIFQPEDIKKYMIKENNNDSVSNS